MSASGSNDTSHGTNPGLKPSTTGPDGEPGRGSVKGRESTPDAATKAMYGASDGKGHSGGGSGPTGSSTPDAGNAMAGSSAKRHG